MRMQSLLQFFMFRFDILRPEFINWGHAFILDCDMNIFSFLLSCMTVVIMASPSLERSRLQHERKPTSLYRGISA